MKKKFLYISIVVLYLLTIAFIMGTLGRMVSLKYEVDERYWRIDGNDNLTPNQKQEAINKLNNRGKQLKMQAYTFVFFAFATFITATGLLVKRKKILSEKKSSA